VFDQHSATDASKNYVIFAFDNEACVGDKAAKCAELETALNAVKDLAVQDTFSKYKDHVSFGKANKDDFPDHKKDFEKAKVPLPAVLFWPAGHSRPSCKFDSDHPRGEELFTWLVAKLKDEDDDDLLELDEGSSLKKVDPAVLVCQADGGPNVVADSLSCSDLIETGLEAEQGLMQLEKTQKIWDYKTGNTKFLGPADNSLPHVVDSAPAVVREIDGNGFRDISKQGMWQALYFQAPWCQYCSCLDPVWDGVAKNLVGTLAQPDLVVAKVNGDTSSDLRDLFNVTAYPTFVVVNKDGNKVLGRYLGPRKVFELSNWIEDLIVADEYPIVKQQFDSADQPAVPDMAPVYPYSGPSAWGDKTQTQTLASLEASIGLTGNEFDDCVDSDEAKFTAPGVALLVHYASSTSIHALEMDIQTVSTHAVPTKPTVVDFMAPWCPHCQKLNPVWDTISADFSNSNDVVIGKVDTEAHPDVKNEFGIHRFPTIMYFDAGKPMAFDEGRRYTGRRDTESLKKWIHDVVLHH